MKVKYLLSFISFLLLFNCGIEDIIYFREPQNVTVDGVNPEKNIVSFYGFNQEETDGQLLFVGYDVYYYFGNSSNAKKAAVKNPFENFAFPTGRNLINFKAVNPARFISFTNTNDLYQQFTIPVTQDMINDVLEEGNSDNVKFCFHDYGLISGGYDNPYVDTGGSKKKLIMDLIYPNFDEYKGRDWADIDENYDDFAGFYDWDYYEAMGIPFSAEAPDGSYRDYTMHIYIIARGFSLSSMEQDYISSIKSEEKTLTMRVLDDTIGH